MKEMQFQEAQDEALEYGSGVIEPFAVTLAKHGLDLVRGETCTLQLNVGLLCNQACRHCHLEAGPQRKEMMGQKTIDDVVAFAQRARFQVIDITGGAPELNPNLVQLIERLTPLAPRVMLRSNLTALSEGKRDFLVEICKANYTVIVASLPSLHAPQVDAQRGKGVLVKSIETLKKLNAAGYGREGTSLELDLVVNPTGAFLPISQVQAEKRFKRDLERKWRVVFNQLFTFANVPLGRFRNWLISSGNYQAYMKRLVSSFNPDTVQELMCKTLLSVSWDGYVFDCDFNLAKRLYLGGRNTYISQLDGPPAPGTPIAVSDHCYGCTAGSGFT